MAAIEGIRRSGATRVGGRAPARTSVDFTVPGETTVAGNALTEAAPAAALASSHTHNADADAAPDSAPRDPARDAKPSGTPHCKNAGTNVHV